MTSCKWEIVQEPCNQFLFGFCNPDFHISELPFRDTCSHSEWTGSIR